MHTPITVFEAWLGKELHEHLADEFESQLEDVQMEFNWLSVDVNMEDRFGDNIGNYAVSDDDNVKKLLDRVQTMYDKMQNGLAELYREKIDGMDTYEDVFREFFSHYDKEYKVGMQLCEYHDTQQELNENHFQMAKNDKANFETLILNFNK